MRNKKDMKAFMKEKLAKTKQVASTMLIGSSAAGPAKKHFVKKKNESESTQIKPHGAHGNAKGKSSAVPNSAAGTKRPPPGRNATGGGGAVSKPNIRPSLGGARGREEEKRGRKDSAGNSCNRNGSRALSKEKTVSKMYQNPLKSRGGAREQK